MVVKFFLYATMAVCLVFLSACNGGGQNASDSFLGINSNTGSSTEKRPLLSYSTSTSFGAVAVGSTTTITITITNVGTDTAILQTITGSGTGFTRSSNVCVSGGSLAIGSTCSFSLALNATVVGSYVSTTILPYTNSGGSIYSLTITQSATASVGAPSMMSSPSAFDFGNHALGSVGTKSIIISNSVSTEAILEASTITGTGYAITVDNCEDETIATPDTCTVTITFTPSAIGASLGTLTIPFSYAGGSASLTVSLSGTGITPTPSLSSSPASWDFGTIATGASSVKSLILSNGTSTAALIGIPSVTGSGYTITTDGCSTQSLVLSGATCTISITYTPVIPGSSLGSLSIPYTYTGGSGTLTVSLSGIGNVPQPTLTITLSSYSFGNVATNVNSSATFTVANNTTAQAIVQTASVSGTGYSITANTCNSTLVGAGGNCSITIRFAPTTTGTFSGILTVPYNSVQSISYLATASLAGTGVTPSVSFSFSGFNGGMTHVTNLTGGGLTLNWAAATSGTPSYYKIVQIVNGVTTVTTAITPVATLTRNITGLLPNTTYQYKINAYDSLDVSDGNTNFISVTTPNVTSATFNGWSDLVATGSVFSSIGAVDNALPNTGANRLDSNLSVTLDSSGNGPVATVKLAWDAFTFSSTATATSHKIWRSATPVSGFVEIGTSATNTYIDQTVTNETTYYYKVTPLIGATEYTPDIADDEEIKVYVPPTNMVLVHRWMANREACVNLLGKSYPSGVNRSSNYSCLYNWGLGFGPNSGAQKTSWDIGYSFIVDRWESGCKMSSAGPIAGTAVAAGGSNGDVYFKKGTSTTFSTASGGCWYKKAGGWYDFNNPALSASDNALMFTNQPGYAPVAVYQSRGYNGCQQRSFTGVGSLRLFRIQEIVAARAWVGVINAPNSATRVNLENGASQSTTFGCNTLFGDGFSTSDPQFFRNSGKILISGSNGSKNCKSRYEIQDLIGNQNEWSSEQTLNCSSAATCVGTTSALDSGANMFDGLAFNGTVGASQAALVTWAPIMVPFIAAPMKSVSATLGSIAFITNSTYQGESNNASTGGLEGVLIDSFGYNNISTGNSSYLGRYSWRTLPTSQLNDGANSHDGNGFRCVGTAPGP